MDKRLKKHDLGFWEIKDKPDSEELKKYYAEKYYQDATGSYEVEYSADELSYFTAKLEQRYSLIQHHSSTLNDNVGTMIDVGCGEGYALAYFRKKGWVVKGIDFSSAGVDSKNPECSDILSTGDIFELLKEEASRGKTYDVVWLQNVLEHVIEPLDLLLSLRSLVTPDGIVVVTVPNDCSLTQQTAIKQGHIDSAFWVSPPDHLTYFNHESLKNAAEYTGWDCLEMLGDFPVDWFLFHPGSNYIKDIHAGKSANMARIQIENLIHEQHIDDVLRFWSAAAKLGIGRNLTMFLRKASKT